MAKKKRKIVLESESWNLLSKSSRKSYLELTTLLNHFVLVTNDHFFRARSAKERATVVTLVRAQVKEYYDNFEDGSGAADCGPLCDKNGECLPCAMWTDLFS